MAEPDAPDCHSKLPAKIEVLSQTPSQPFLAEWFDLSTRDHFWFEWRLRATLELARGGGLPLEAPLRALEVGCGTGVLRSQLEGATRWTIDATDLDLAALRRMEEGRGQIYSYDIFDRDSRFKDAYDLVILYDVLEHIEETPPFLDAVLYHLKPGGWLLLNVPALPRLYSEYDRAAGHFRRYVRRSLAHEFSSSSLQVERMRYWGLCLLPIAWLRKGVVRLLRGDDSRVIETGFRVPGRLAHAVLNAVMRVETSLLRSPPLGTSLLLLGRKAS